MANADASRKPAVFCIWRTIIKAKIHELTDTLDHEIFDYMPLKLTDNVASFKESFNLSHTTHKLSYDCVSCLQQNDSIQTLTMQCNYNLD